MLKQALAKSVFSNTLYNYLGQLLITPLTFVLSIYLVRKLSVYDYGTLRILTSISTYILLLSWLGIPSAVHRYVSEFYSLGNYSALKAIVSWALVLRLSAVSGLVIITGAIIGYLASLLQAPGIVYLFPLFAFSIAMRGERDILDAVLRSLLLERYNNLAKIAYYAIQLVALFGMLEAGRGLLGVIVAFVVADLALMILYILKVREEIFTKESSTGLGPDREFLKRAFRYAGYNYLS